MTMTQSTIQAERLQKLRALIRETGVDGILLRKRRHFSWLTDGSCNHIVNTTELGVADLVVFADEVFCITTKIESARIGEEELNDFACNWITPEWYEGTEAAIATLCHGKKIGCDVAPESVNLPTGIDLGKSISELSYVLDERDQERYRWLSQTVASAVEATCREIEPGMTEFEIQALLASKVIRLGCNPHVILISTDERIYRYRHPIPTDKRLQSYAMLVLCAEKWGLITNVTRFVHFGPLSEELIVNKTKLAQIDVTMNLATRPGTAIKDVLQTGIEAYRKLGFGDDWRYLHQGGPTGYASREFLATPTSEGIVQLHQAFAWNPAVRGVKSEDTILVGADGNEFLTDTGKWEYIQIEVNGQVYRRPDILIR